MMKACSVSETALLCAGSHTLLALSHSTRTPEATE
jgi:hypothetical protein